MPVSEFTFNLIEGEKYFLEILRIIFTNLYVLRNISNEFISTYTSSCISCLRLEIDKIVPHWPGGLDEKEQTDLSNKNKHCENVGAEGLLIEPKSWQYFFC